MTASPVLVPHAGVHSAPNTPAGPADFSCIFAPQGQIFPQRLMDRIAALSIPEPNSGCWLWTGTLSDSGYAQIKIGGKNGTKRRAHRIAYELTHGPVPDDLFVCHKCDVRACVNPGHLFAGSHVDNMRDMAAKGRWKNGVGSPEIALSIRNAKGTIREIADRFGVHSSTVHNIKRRKHWGHI